MRLQRHLGTSPPQDLLSPNSTLYCTYTHLVCRDAVPGPKVLGQVSDSKCQRFANFAVKVRDKSDLSHEVHADNCTVRGSTCDPSPPAYRLQNKRSIFRRKYCNPGKHKNIPKNMKISQPWQTQLPISLRPPLPQLPAQTVQRRPLLLRRPSSWRTSLHPDVIRRASMRTTLGVHIWTRELARSDACCRWHQVMFCALDKKKSLNFKNQFGFV